MTEMPGSRELAVLVQLDEALGAIDEDGARRVLNWLNDKYRVKGDGATVREVRASAVGRSLDSAQPPMERVDFPTLYSRAQPETEKERALVAGYWFQAVNNEVDLDSQTLNKELKNLGHPISNITKALGYLIAQRPQLVIQTRKSGGSQQARKKYRLTRAGTDYVEAMLSRNVGQ